MWQEGPSGVKFNSRKSTPAKESTACHPLLHSSPFFQSFGVTSALPLSTPCTQFFCWYFRRAFGATSDTNTVNPRAPRPPGPSPQVDIEQPFAETGLDDVFLPGTAELDESMGMHAALSGRSSADLDSLMGSSPKERSTAGAAPMHTVGAAPSRIWPWAAGGGGAGHGGLHGGAGGGAYGVGMVHGGGGSREYLHGTGIGAVHGGGGSREHLHGAGVGMAHGGGGSREHLHHMHRHSLSSRDLQGNRPLRTIPSDHELREEEVSVRGVHNGVGHRGREGDGELERGQGGEEEQRQGPGEKARLLGEEGRRRSSGGGGSDGGAGVEGAGSPRWERRGSGSGSGAGAGMGNGGPSFELPTMRTAVR